MPRITNTYLKLKVICTQLPGTRFEDPHSHKPKIKEPDLGPITGHDPRVQRNPIKEPVFFIFPGGSCKIRVILRCFGGLKFASGISIGRRLIGHLNRVIPLL